MLSQCHASETRRLRSRRSRRREKSIFLSNTREAGVSCSATRKKYGMIQPGGSSTKAVRAVFIIDPKGIIRTSIYYPLSMGRNLDELYRVILALQTADAFLVATPADWRPGDDVIVPTAGSCGVAKERMEDKQNMTCYDWFFCTKKIDKQKVLSTTLKK